MGEKANILLIFLSRMANKAPGVSIILVKGWHSPKRLILSLAQTADMAFAKAADIGVSQNG